MKTSDNNSNERCRTLPCRRWLRLAVAVVLVCIVSFLVIVVRWLREDVRSLSCQGRLGQIGLALQNYHQVHGSFPPAYVTDQDGRPMHSWRVLLLPYLELKDVHARYDFSQPWNSPGNSALAKSAVLAGSYFRCPSDSGSGLQGTSYVAVVGAGTLWPGEHGATKQSVQNRTRILLVETRGSGIHWMEPRDMTYEEAIKGLVQSSPHPGRVHVLLSNGDVGVLEEGSLSFHDMEGTFLHRLLSDQSEGD